MREISKDQIEDALEKDYIGRNAQLRSLINVINNTPLDSSPVIALDSPWGSGKTIFVKQLTLLSESEEVKAGAIEGSVIEDFRSKYTTYYFNAWENDHLNDPLEALLLNIIDDMEKDTKGLQRSAAEKALKIFDLAEYIKKKTDGLINIKKFSSPDELIKEASEVSKRKERVREILANYIEYKEKRLIFIVDELDRCKPSFAINLLEALKHYFADNNIVFIFSVDSIQLSHTIKKYYGSDFDGAAYLDRFFDYTMSLQEPDKDRFVREYLRTSNSNYFVDNIPSYIADYLDFSLREMEHYIKSLEFVEGYMSSSDGYGGKNQLTNWFGQLMFIPLALALKIKKHHEFTLLIRGRGRKIISELLAESEDMQSIVRWRLDSANKDRPLSEVIDIMLDCYDRLFSASSNRDDYHVARTRDRVLAAVNVISQGTTVKQLETKGRIEQQ